MYALRSLPQFANRRSPALPSKAMTDSLRVLYVCYLSLDDPLVHTQVVAYLEGLAARGHTVHLLTFDTPLSSDRRSELRADLERRGITWHSRRYHKRPSLPATAYDAVAGALTAARIVRRHGLDTIHARNHVPVATALIVRRLTGCSMIFDLRGLMAEEYVDAGTWRRGGIPYRATNWVQRAGLRRADGVVMLTEAVRRHLFDGREPDARVEVIPCCADLDAASTGAGGGTVAELGLADRPTLVYVGKFGGWYMGREMVQFFLAARQLQPTLAFLVITQSDPALIQSEFAAAGVTPADYRVTRSDPSAIGAYLSSADVGISFVRPCLSKISSSPTKIGEYLAAGLPVVSTAGIGDVDALLSAQDIGVLVRGATDDAYAAAARDVFRLAADVATGERCKSVARDRLSLEGVGVPRYDRLYRGLAARMDG
jgi:glycosyltransferase involved in cell wall biosynthesis